MQKRLTYEKYLRLEPYFHVLLWTFVLIYPYLKYIEREGGYPMSFLHEVNSLFFKMTISYFVYFWFLPKKNRHEYWPLLVIFFIANVVAYEYFDQLFHGGFRNIWNHFIASSLTYASFSIAFFAIYSVKNTYQKQAEIDRLTLEKRNAQLQTLKAKVNPHFLFNTLNTVYASALKKEDKTPELILKLSDGFRYVLHEGEKELVSIGQEMEHLRDYIQLQQERLSTKVKVEMTTEIDNPEQAIPPLLLIGFIENAFKFTSVMKGHGHAIDISITLRDHLLQFYCQNPYTSDLLNTDTAWKESGTGIKNTQDRLDLCYPNQHRLEITKSDSLFSLHLEISL